MKRPEQFIDTLALKRSFYDAHEERAYLRAVETARRLLVEPALLERGTEHLERFVRPDPHQARYYALWSETLAQGVTEVVRKLLEDSERGAALRDSSPVFVPLSKEELTALWNGSRR